LAQAMLVYPRIPNKLAMKAFRIDIDADPLTKMRMIPSLCHWSKNFEMIPFAKTRETEGDRKIPTSPTALLYARDKRTANERGRREPDERDSAKQPSDSWSTS
jgi:hypothetical protein